MTEKAQALRQLVDQGKKDFFNAGYEATDAEALGILISQFFEWDGRGILRTAEAALEDANFHTESGMVAEMARKVESDG